MFAKGYSFGTFTPFWYPGGGHLPLLVPQVGGWEAVGVLWGSGAAASSPICPTNDSCQSSHYLYYAEDRELHSLIHTLLYLWLYLAALLPYKTFVELLPFF